MREREHVLQLENITMQFGGVVAVNNLSLEVNKGEIVALIGPNGAGKTTAFNVITGVYQPTNGQALFHDKVYLRNHPQGKMKKGYKGENGLLYTSEYKLEGQKTKEEEKQRDHYVFSNHVLAPTPDHITKMGIARTFQNIRLWKSMTVFDNVIIAKHMRAKHNVFSSTFRISRKEEARMREETEALLREQGLWQHRDALATGLPYGLQRRLEIARALATEPKLLLLDEPAAGMNPQETLELADFIHEIRDKHHLTILLIEHHMDLVMNISDRIYVLDFGSLIAQGLPSEIQKNQHVIDAYLGVVEDEPILSIQNLQVNYGGIEAVKGISFDVPEGEIVTLIGANGAGKSSTLRAISGLVKPKGGKILFRGEDITGKNPTEIVSRGVTLVPEGRRIFADLTVKENLRVGAYLRKDDISEDMEWVFSLFPRLREREWQAGGTLSGGEQQMLAVGRALMSRPKVMMMDEPSLGLAPLVVREIFRIIEEVNKKGVTILLIEQNANMALKTADMGYVMETGRVTMSGPGQELLANESVKAAYLGT